MSAFGAIRYVNVGTARRGIRCDPSSRRPCGLVDDRTAGARSFCFSPSVRRRPRGSPSRLAGEAPAALRCAAASIAALPLSRGERVETAPKVRSSRRRDACTFGSLDPSLRSRLPFSLCLFAVYRSGYARRSPVHGPSTFRER